MLSVMNNNVDLDREIKGLGEKHAVFDDYSEDKKGVRVDDNDDVDSSGKVIGNGKPRVSNLKEVNKDENWGGNVESVDLMVVDAQVKKSKKFSGGSAGSVVETDIQVSVVGKGKNDKERPRKKLEKVEKLYVSEEFTENGRLRTLEYEIGDLVWGKVKSHPWWPGQIYSEELASSEVRRSKTTGYVLVAFFGDCSYGWFDPAEIVPFDSSYVEKSQQTSSRTFVKAVEEAVDEASRRRSLGLACRCRKPYNFRPTTVKGYFSVDLGDYESGSIYSVDQIRKSRNDFQPTEVLDFVNQLALSPIDVEHEAIDFVKNKATALAYRKAVYEEFDETYAQAFGYEPERPSRGHMQDQNRPPKLANPAPLSGPLVIAEVLRKEKGSAKSHKSKDQAKKDRFLFKRRDEPNELKTSVQVHLGQAASSEKPLYVEGSLAISAGEHALQKKSLHKKSQQKKSLVVSRKHKVSAKQQGTESSARDEVSDQRQEAGGKGDMTMDDKHSGVEFGHAGSQMNLINSSNSKPGGDAPSQFCHAYEAKPSLGKEKDAGLESRESSRSEVGLGHAGMNTSDSVADVPCPVDVKNDGARLKAIKSVQSLEQFSSQAAKTKVHGEQAKDGCDGDPSGTGNAKSHKEGPDFNNGIQAKKVKVRKRPAEELNSENSRSLMKKKRKKEVLSSENIKISPSGGEVEPSAGSVAKLPVHVATSSRVDLHVEPQGIEGKNSSETILEQKTTQVEKIELELPQLLHSLQALARSGTYSNGYMAVVRQTFLRYRSLVFEKSLAPLPATDSKSTEISISEPPAYTKAIDIDAADVRERSSIKPQRQVARPDDPSKGGRKRGPSDRQEEIAAKKKKKINDMKNLKAKKEAAQKTLITQREDVIKEASVPTMKSLRPVHFKKREPSSRAPDPVMLVMKFPPQGTLPSIMELKARFARFGQLDHSATRIFWKTSTCRLVYRHRADAESACKFAASSSILFGNTDVKCYTREVEVAASVTESSKAQKDDSSMGNSQLRDSAVERRPATSLPLRTLQQPGGQIRSILKKSNGNETTSGTTGGGRGTRVKFILGEEETNRGGEQLMIGNKNINNNASFVDGGASSSHHGMDFNSKNIVIPPSPMPILPLPPAVQFLRPPDYLHHTELAPRNAHNLNTAAAPPPMTPGAPNIDISQQMMGLLNKCNDVVNKLTAFLGYLPLHPL